MRNKFLLALLSIVLLSSCIGSNHDKYYDYNWVVDVIYTNGDKEQLTIEQKKVVKEWKLYLYSGDGEACLYKGNGYYNDAVACGVRKFTIVTETKTESNN